MNPVQEQRTLRSDRTTAAIPDGKHVVDTGASTVAFRAKAFGMMWVCGTLPVATGQFSIIEGRLSGAGELDAVGVSTGIGLRDWHLRTSHYLKTKQHPRIHVLIDDADLTAGEVDATIVVRGQPKVVRLLVDTIDPVIGGLKLRAHVDLDRTGIPMLPPVAGVSRNVEITLEVVAHVDSATDETATDLYRLQDERSIVRALYDCADHYDNGRWGDVGAMFADGAWWLSEDVSLHGTQEVCTYLDSTVKLYAGSPRTRHAIGNIRVNVAADRLTAEASSTVVVFQALPGEPPTTLIQAVYHDVLQSSETGWRFKERRATVDGAGQIADHLALPS
jgi:polyisoprenoid-binding protein YceI